MAGIFNTRALTRYLGKASKSIVKEINTLNGRIVDKVMERDSIIIKEPTDYIDTIKLEQKREVVSDIKLNFGILNNSLSFKEKNILDLHNSEVCPVCKKDLDDVDHTKEIDKLKKDVDNDKLELTKISKKLKKEGGLLKSLEKLKGELDLYDKNKLVKEKKVLEIESLENTRKDKNTLTSKYESNQKKIEHNKNAEIDKLKIQTKLDTHKLKKDGLLDKKNATLIKKEHSNRTLQGNLENIKKIKKEEQVQMIFKTYLTAFGKNGIPKVILKSLMPVINNELSHLLSGG